MNDRNEAALNLICENIENEYNDIFNGSGAGYRFMMSPKQTFSKETKIALITLNPGGKAKPVGHPECYTEKQAAYLCEKWRFNGKPYAPGEQPLQKQIRGLFKIIHDKTGLSESGDTLLNNSFCAQYIPFRSNSYKELRDRETCKQFSKGIWGDIFKKYLDPSLTICMDKVTFSELKAIFGQTMEVSSGGSRLETGWGNIKVDIVRYSNGKTLVRFPHLSRFRIFGRRKSEKYVEKIMTEVTGRI